ncbi:hypothetical protein Tco_1277358 [Tanacetum coccineum]
MAESSNVSFLVGEEGVVNRHVSQLPRERLVSVLRFGVLLAELRDLGDCGDGDVTLGLLERLHLDNVEKAIRLRLMMKETELKIAEKCSSNRRLKRNEAA